MEAPRPKPVTTGEPPLRTSCRPLKPRRVISELYRQRVERMFDLFYESVDPEMYWRPETWTWEFARRFGRLVTRLGALREGARAG